MDRERLSAVQERLRALICAPNGVAAALAEEGDAEGASLATLLRGDARAGAGERLEIYANAYFARLLEVLRDDYPALAAALGDDHFHDLVTAYLLAHPPTRPSLRDAGAFVRGFLDGASAEAAYFRVRWPWSADLAALEWALVDAFDAPDAPALARERLAALAPELSPEAWDALPLRLHPATALLTLRWPVQRLRADHERGALYAHPVLEAAPTVLCVTRRDERVRYRALDDPLETALLPALAGGLSFGALCLRIAELRDEASAPSLAADLLSRWIEAGALAESR